LSERRLDRLLWRVRHGSLAPEIAESELRDALRDLEDAAAELLRDRAALRRWSPALISDQADAFLRAGHAIDRLAFGDTVKHLRRCERSVASLQALLHAVASVERAEAELNTLGNLASNEQLRRLPAVASLAQIVVLARESISVGQFGEASHIASNAGRLAATLLQQRTGNESNRDELLARLEAVDVICRESAPYASVATDDLASAGALHVLRELVDGGYFDLALRLLTELEIAMAPRRRFLGYVRGTERNGAAIESPDALRSLVAAHSWEGAIDTLWHQSMARHSRSLLRQLQWIEATGSQLDAAIAPPAALE
jgi:hypothetical protein